MASIMSVDRVVPGVEIDVVAEGNWSASASDGRALDRGQFGPSVDLDAMV
jgi:hypothetical protein